MRYRPALLPEYLPVFNISISSISTNLQPWRLSAMRYRPALLPDYFVPNIFKRVIYYPR
jgi:hypothetical protein